MAGGGKRRSRDYLNDFRRDLNGNYCYDGAHLFYNGPWPRTRALSALWALCGGALAALAAVGFLPVPGAMHRAYVLLPYAAALVACVSAVWALGRVTAGGDPLRAYVYEQAAAKLPLRCRLGAVCAALAAAGECIDLFLYGGQSAPGSSAAYLVLAALAAAALAGAGAVSGRMKYAAENRRKDEKAPDGQ